MGAQRKLLKCRPLGLACGAAISAGQRGDIANGAWLAYFSPSSTSRQAAMLGTFEGG